MIKKILPILFCILLLGSVWAQGGDEEMALTIRSIAFEMGSHMAPVYTCDDRDISPPLSWENVPEATKSFALICDDPDAPVGTWVHWVIYNIPAGARGLSEDVPPQAKLKDGTLQGKNDFGRLGYGGPCPPPGKPHRYFFKLYALDTVLQVSSGLTKKDLLKATKGHVLAEAEFHGLYSR